MVPEDARVKLLDGLLARHHQTDPRGALASPTQHTHFIRDGVRHAHHQLLGKWSGEQERP